MRVRPVALVAVLALLVAVVAVAVWMRSGRDPVHLPPPGPTAVNASAPAPVAKAPAKPAPAPVAAQPGKTVAEVGQFDPVRADPPTPLSVPERPVRTNHVVSFRSASENPADNYIRTEADQMIAFAMQASDATGMPPLPAFHYPDGGNKAFLDSLTNEIVVLETDPPNVREMKEGIIDIRGQILEIIEAGGTFEEAIREYYNRVNENANLRLSAVRRYQELKAEDPAAAAEYAATVNEVLEEHGVMPIDTTGRRGRGRGKGNSGQQEKQQ